MPDVGINILTASTWTPLLTNGELTRRKLAKSHNSAHMCRKSSWCRIRKASDWHHKCFYLSRDAMTPGARQDSRIRCRTWAMYFLLRADLCRFRHGIYLRSFMRLLNKWLPSTCYCPLSNEELAESRVWSCLPVSYTLVGDVGRHTGTRSDSCWVTGKLRCLESIRDDSCLLWWSGSFSEKWKGRFRLGWRMNTG